MHKSQIFFYILLAFIGGIFAGSFFNISQLLVWAIFIACMIAIVIFYRRDSRIFNAKIALTAFLAIFFFLGVLRFNIVQSRQRALEQIAKASSDLKDPANKHRIKITLYGFVNDEPVIKGDKQELVLYAQELESPPHRVGVSERILITTRLYPAFHYGQTLKVYGELKIPQNSDTFDYRSYLAKDDIYTTTNYPDIAETSYELPLWQRIKIKIFSGIFKIKAGFERSIGRAIAEPNASFVNGILLGSRSQIPQEIKAAFARTSTSHILAVSGYNITIIATIISWFFLLFFRRPVAFWFSTAGVVFFTILTGAQASVMRAAVMGILVLLAQREGRLSSPRNAIVLAGAAMIFLNPRILRYDIGFQLSFMATLGLIYVSPIIEKYFAKIPDLFNFRETMLMTLSAQIFVLPLLLFYFKNLSLTSLPTNIIVLPTIPFAMLLGFASGIGGLILPFLGQLIGYFAWLLTYVELGIIKLFAKPSWAAANISLNWYGVIIAYALIILVLIRLKRGRNKAKTSY